MSIMKVKKHGRHGPENKLTRKKRGKEKMTNEQTKKITERIARLIGYFNEMWASYCLHPRKEKICRDIANEYDGQVQGLVIALLMLGVSADKIKYYVDERVEDKRSVGYIHFKSVLQAYSTKF